MKKLYIPLILFVAMGLNLSAQEKSRREKKGDKYTFSYSYTKAIDSYSHARKLTPEGQRRLAESYHKMNQDVESEATYSKLITAGEGVIPEDHYNYAMVLKINGKQDESNRSMDKFSAAKPADLRAKSYERNKGNFSDMHTDEGKYQVVTQKLNTGAEDFGTSYYKDKIVFTSSRAPVKMVRKNYNWNDKPFLNMYVSEVKEGQLQSPEIFDKSLNAKMHDGPASFSKDGTFMAFSRNTQHDKTKDKIVELQVYFRTYKDDKWSEPEAFTFNSPEYSVAHPSLSADGKTMYFTSDMPGGYGGTDLYRTQRDANGIWSKPENLGDKINTEGDELFPFFEGTNETLFFASNGHFGLGGLDIFISQADGKSFGTVYNAGAPLNSPADDFSVIADDKLNKGYFSSNRSSGSGDDDIYSVEFLKSVNAGKKIKGFAKGKDGAVLPNTFIALLDDKGKVLDTLTTKADGAFSFSADSDKNFKLTGKKENYSDGDSLTNTFGKEPIVKADVILRTKDQAIEEKVAVVGNDLAKIIEFQPIYFDLDKSNIRQDAATELNKIVKLMNKYPKMVIELKAYTDCRESKEYNQLLSDRRAKASSEYISSRISNPGRISGKGYGKTKLVNNCSCDGEVVSTCSEEEHQKNRRTEFIIVVKGN
ncbi:MAG: hypothetical protein JWO09_3218 [Bacteroidetes bacterium]|nr:hypothetical protein [Bacteroidota bacterium]